MALRGAQKGNKNASKGKPWQEALVKALKQFESDEVARGQALFKVANKVVQDALAGSKDAWAEIGNRLDGKSTERMEISDPEGTLRNPAIVNVTIAGAKP